MLSECNGFIIAPSRAEAAQLERMAARVGFGDVATSSSHRDDRRSGVAPFTTLVIRRDPAQGISVRRRHMIGLPQRPVPDAATHYLPRRLAPGAAASRFFA